MIPPEASSRGQIADPLSTHLHLTCMFLSPNGEPEDSQSLSDGSGAANGLDPEQFRSRLIGAIADNPERAYWDCWIVAPEKLLVEHHLTTADEVAGALEQYAYQLRIELLARRQRALAQSCHDPDVVWPGPW